MTLSSGLSFNSLLGLSCFEEETSPSFPLCLFTAKHCIDVQEVNATHSLVRRVLAIVFQLFVFQPFRSLKQGLKVLRYIAVVQLDVQVGVQMGGYGKVWIQFLGLLQA